MIDVQTVDLSFQGCPQVIASYLVPHDDGVVVCEPGPYSTYPALLKALEAAGYQPSDVTDVLVTHVHFDHAGAAWALARAGARVHVHPLGAPHLANPSRLWNSAARIYGEDGMQFLWGEMQAIDQPQLQSWEHLQSESIRGLHVQAYHTPGHAKHHIAWAIDDAIFLGDVGGVKIEYGPVEPPCPPPDIDVEAWLRSIALLRKQALNRQSYLTHFGAVEYIEDHLDALENALRMWAAKAQVLFESGDGDAADQFTEFVEQQRPTGADAYALANPASMSWPGLERYWKKKLAV